MARIPDRVIESQDPRPKSGMTVIKRDFSALFAKNFAMLCVTISMIL